MANKHTPIRFTILNDEGVPYTYYSNGRGLFTLSHPVHNKMNRKITSIITRSYFKQAYEHDQAVTN